MNFRKIFEQLLKKSDYFHPPQKKILLFVIKLHIFENSFILPITGFPLLTGRHMPIVDQSQTVPKKRTKKSKSAQKVPTKGPHKSTAKRC